MKRIIFRCLIACLTFLIGTVITLIHNRRLPNPQLTGQELSKPEWQEQAEPKPVSVATKRIGSLPVSIDEEKNYASLQFINEQEGWFACEDKLWRTQDGGKSWKNVFTARTNSEREEAYVGKFEFINSRVGWLISSYKMYKTEDRGNTWRVFNQPIHYNYDDGLPIGIYDFEFLKDGKHGWVIGDKYRPVTTKEQELYGYPHPRYSYSNKVLASLIYYTEDGGRSWTQQPLTSGWYDVGGIYALDEKHAWVAGLAGVYYLQNGKWLSVKSNAVDDKGYPLVNSLDVAIGAPTDSPSFIFFVNSQIGWIVNSNGYLGKSVDGGRTWSDVSGELDSSSDLSPWRWAMQVYFIDPINGWGLDGDGKLVKTKDGGVSWETVDENNQFSAMYFLDCKHGWAIDKEGLFQIMP